MTELRLVTPDDTAPLLTDDDAIAAINQHWTAALETYADVITALGSPLLRQLIVPPKKRAIARRHMADIHAAARDLARHATRMADELDRAVTAYDRRNTGGAQ